MLCNVEENLENKTTRSPRIGKPHYGGPEAKTPSVPPISQSLSGIYYPKKKIGATEKQTGYSSQST